MKTFKKALLISTSIFLSISTFAQTNKTIVKETVNNVVAKTDTPVTQAEPKTSEKYQLLYYKDIMTDKEYIYSKDRILYTEDAKKGFSVSISWNFEKSKVNYNGISVKSVGIGNCVENDDLIILFEDNTKVSLKSWNKFNCNGNSYFDLNTKELNNLNKRIKAIRFQNGRTFESSTYEVSKEKDITFFIDAKNALDMQTYKVVDKM
jgi:hypothetical protein